MTASSRGRQLLLVVFLFLLIVGCVASVALAEEEEADSNQVPEVDMPAMKVVAKPVIEGNRLDRFGATTTVVTKDQIEDLNAIDLPEALVRVPGVTISRHNHVGSFGGGEGGAVFIRGKGSSRPGAEIKTYVDDVPMYMGPWNHPLMDLLPVDAADAIEVIKGPQPQRYGDTLSAVNLVPKRQHGEESSTTVDVAVGSYGTVSESVEHGGKIGDFDYYVGEGYIRSDGHRQDSWGSKLGYYANLGYALDDAWDIRMVALGATNRSSDPGPDTVGGQSEGTYGTNAQMVSLSLSHDYEYLDGDLKFFVNTGEGNWKDQDGDAYGCYNDFTFYGLRLAETVHPWTGMDLVLGLDQDWWRSQVRNTFDAVTEENSLKPPDFSLTMPYFGASQFLGDRNGLYMIPSAGVRFYEHNKYDSESAPFAGLIVGYADTEAHVAASRGIVYPGHDVIVMGFKDWEELDAETTDHLELGLSHNFFDVVRAEVLYFKDDGRNRYVFSGPPPLRWFNTGVYKIKGWEFTVNVTPTDDLSLFAGLTLQDVEDPDDLPYAPETTFTAGFTWRFLEDFTLNMDGQYVDEMYVLRQARASMGPASVNTEEVDSHFVLSGRLGWEFETDLLGTSELYLAMENLLDEEYEYKPDYPMPGINGTLGLKVMF